MSDLDTVRIEAIEFLNGDSVRYSIGRLGQSALPSGVSSAATVALVRLTCQAHGVDVYGLSRDYLVRHLRELSSLKLIYWNGDDSLKLA